MNSQNKHSADNAKLVLNPVLSVILPCLNEEASLAPCLNSLLLALEEAGLGDKAEIIIIDNASTDTTAEIAKKFIEKDSKIRLATEDRRGYGSAYLKGFEIARGEYVAMIDADLSYNFKNIPDLLNELIRTKADLALGNRFSGKMERNAMPWLHRYFGNPLFSLLTSLFFKKRIRDTHSGLRIIRKSSFEHLKLQTIGMEFASEMIIQAVRHNLSIVEVPISYHPRVGKSKLRSFSDGWRHLRFILLFSPTYLFMAPGIVLFLLGAILMITLDFSNPVIFGVTLIVHPILLSSTMIILGYQLIIFMLFAKTYAVTHLREDDTQLRKLFAFATLEKAVILGGLCALVGVIIYANIFYKWIRSDFGTLNEIKSMTTALTFTVLGIQTVFSGFMISILGIKER